ncbi:uncharacterized protein LOC34622536 [Cyclospora cayetanensis]|uniref:Cleavage stimulation factor 50 kDa subunit n=1 Tax=Cyclospora cayetanensis TaxID=88456 RepID=A0A6P6RWX3_9EIME|nr:uncharacterized protein LOC34622536 [Cyclospora cayetanensis]
MDICMKEELGAPADAAKGPSVTPVTPEGVPRVAPERDSHGSIQAGEESAPKEVDGQKAIDPTLSLHPLKVSFYEAVAKQLLDDELHEVAVALCGALRVRANVALPPDLLFSIYKAAAFQPSQEVAGAAAALTAQNLLLGGSPPDSDPATRGITGGSQESSGTSGALAAAGAAARTTEEGETLSPTSPSRSGSLAEDRQWQPLRPRAVPPLTEGEQQLVFNPYPNSEGRGPPGAIDTRGLEAQVTSTIVCSASFQYVRMSPSCSTQGCVSAACNGDMSVVVAGALDGSVRLLPVKSGRETPGATVGGPPSSSPPGGVAAGNARVLQKHDGPVSSVVLSPDSRICFSGSSDSTVKLFDISATKAKPAGGPIDLQLFDGVTGLLANKIPDAHNGMPVTSLMWSRSGRFLLSSGFDGHSRIWDVRRGQQLLAIRTGTRTDRRAVSVFLQTEAFIASFSGGDFNKKSGICAMAASPFSFSAVTGTADGEYDLGRFPELQPRVSETRYPQLFALTHLQE